MPHYPAVLAPGLQPGSRKTHFIMSTQSSLRDPVSLAMCSAGFVGGRGSRMLASLSSG